MITVRDERGRRKRFYKDVVGRLARVEELKQGQGWASGGCDGGEPWRGDCLCAGCRAWDEVKRVEYGEGVGLSVGYDNWMRLVRREVVGC